METVISPGRSRTSWGAIFAGGLVALAVQVLLVMLGLAVGAAAIDPSAANPFAGIGIGSVIWLVVSGIVSLFAGAYVTGRLSGVVNRSDGGLNGLVVWALFLVVSLFVAGSGAAGVVGGVFSLGKQGAQAAGSVDRGVVEDIITRSGLTEPPPPNAPPLTQQQREAAQSLAKNSGLTQQEAENAVRRGKQELGQLNLGQQAQNIGGAVATYSSAALFGLVVFFALLLVASYLGGAVGARAKREEVVVTA